MSSSRVLKRKIRSINSIQQITRAMKMVSSIRLKRSREHVGAATPFAAGIERLAASLYAHTRQEGDAAGLLHPLMSPHESGRTVLVVVTSERGLAGGYNAAIMRATFVYIREHGRDTLDVVTVGRKGRNALAAAGIVPVKEFPGASTALSYDSVEALGRELIDRYLGGARDVKVIHAYLKSIIQQPVVVERMLPVALEPGTERPGTISDYLLEPAGAELLARLIPVYVKSRLYRMLLDSSTAEHAARMAAMESASKSAQDVIDQMVMKLNKARQERITQEIAEITAGSR